MTRRRKSWFVSIAMLWAVACWFGSLDASDAAARLSPSLAFTFQPIAQPKQRFDLLGDLLPDGAVARMGTARWWHDYGAQALAISPDGATLATTDGSLAIHVWEAATGKSLLDLQGHKNSVSALAIAPNGRTLASAGKDKTIRLWDVDNGKAFRVIDDYQSDVDELAYSPDGKNLAAGLKDGTVRLLDPITGKQLHVLDGHLNGWSASIAFAPDGKTLATADKQIRIWNAATGKLLRSFPPDFKALVKIAFSPDGRMLAAGGTDLIIHVFEVNTGKERLSLKGHEPRLRYGSPVASLPIPVAFSPDGKTLVSSGPDETVRFWDASTGKQVDLIRAQLGAPFAFAPDGKTLYASGSNRRLTVWDVAARKSRSIFDGHNEWVRAVALAPDGKTVASGADDLTVRIWDAATGKEIRRFGHNDKVFSVAFSPDGKALASASWDKTVVLWDPATGKPRLTLEHGDWVNNVAFSPDGKVVASSGIYALRLWDAATGKELVSKRDEKGSYKGVAFSRDGKTIAAEREMSSFIAFDLLDANTLETIYSWQVKNNISGFTTPVLAFSPDGKTLVAAVRGEVVKRWDIKTRNELPAWGNAKEKGVALGLSPDGKTLVTYLYLNGLHLWDLESGKLLRKMGDHTYMIFATSFSADGKRLATSSMDSTVLVWDVER